MGERNAHMDKLPGILLKLRADKGVTQREAAEAIGITYSVLASYEKGTKAPSLEFAYRLADYYGVSLDELCGRVNPDDGSPASLKRAFLVLRRNIAAQSIEYKEVHWKDSAEVCEYNDTDYFVEEASNPGLKIMCKEAHWDIYDSELARFMESYDQLSSLVEKRQIDQSVLDIWLEKQLSDMASTGR